MKKTYKGMTLIEVLLVIALIAVLAAITFIAINPAKNFADARNATRSSDALQILNAVTQYTSEQGHTLSGLGTIPACTTESASIGTDGVDLGAVLVPDYIVGIPKDPSNGTDAVTGYSICTTPGNRVRVTSDGAENKTIEIQR